MKLTRYHDWPERLSRIIASAPEAGFQWGIRDCFFSACDCIRAMTGEDPGASLRGTYSDEAAALAIVGSDLGEAFATRIAASYSMEEIIPVTFARRGDIVLVNNGTPLGVLGIVSLDGRYAACMGESRMLRAHMHRWKRAWKVG